MNSPLDLLLSYLPILDRFLSIVWILIIGIEITTILGNSQKGTVKRGAPEVIAMIFLGGLLCLHVFTGYI